jgi:Calcineurin-like phosphoesterase
MTRIAVLGDLSGHLTPFAGALRGLGVDLARAEVPDDLVVVQVGDLVHKGPDSDMIVAVVDRLLDANPGRYVQLLGNHEDQYLGGQRFYTQTPLALVTVATLRRWRADGTLRVAAALRTASGESFLVTHAGLTRLNFVHHVGSDDAGQAARVLNDLWERNPKVIHTAGVMLHDLRSGMAGPLWAETTRELYPGWLLAAAAGQSPPFGQIHGHCPVFDFAGVAVHPLPADLARVAVVDQARRQVRVMIGGQRFINIDPGFDDRPPGPARLHPVVFDAELLPPR